MLWIVLQMVAHLEKYTKREETPVLLNKFEQMKKNGDENQNIFRKHFEELLDQLRYSLTSLKLKLKNDADENKAKIEILENYITALK